MAVDFVFDYEGTDRGWVVGMRRSLSQILEGFFLVWFSPATPLYIQFEVNYRMTILELIYNIAAKNLHMKMSERNDLT